SATHTSGAPHRRPPSPGRRRTAFRSRERCRWPPSVGKADESRVASRPPVGAAAGRSSDAAGDAEHRRGQPSDQQSDFPGLEFASTNCRESQRQWPRNGSPWENPARLYQLSDAQALVLASIYDVLQRHGKWPTYGYLERFL